MDYFGPILLAIIGVMIVLSIWLTSGPYSDRYPQDENSSSQATSQGYGNIDERSSSDFGALINAVHYEGRANRKEDNREDNGKAIRDIVTISILFLTFVALAETCVAIFKQVDDARDAVIVSQRAWIDPAFVTLPAPIVAGSRWYIRSVIKNVGHSPATAFAWAFENGFRPAQKPNAFERFDAGTNSTCDGLTPDDKLGSVEFPATQSASDPATLDFVPGFSNSPKVKNRIVADEDMISGKHFFYLQGCFVYRMLNREGKSRFCFFFQNIGGSYSENRCGDNAAE